MAIEPIHDRHSDPPVRGYLHRPARPKGTLALTHGAGSNCGAPLLVSLADALAEAGYAVLRFDLPFRQEQPHGPPRGSASRDQAGVLRAIEVARGLVSGRVFVGGASYGGRQASMALAEHPGSAAGLLLLSYPLHAPGKAMRQRTQHFPQLRVPTLFVQGTRDPFASAEEIEAARKVVGASNELLLIDGAGHDLGFGRKTSDETVVPGIVEAFRDFFEQ